MSLTARDKAELGLPINYITNGGAESTTQGWATYANSAANIPSTGTGGSPSSTWTSSTSSPLQANASFLWTKAGSANRQGEGVAYPFTINTADQAQVLSLQCSYTIVSGTFTASNGSTAPLNDGTTSTNAGNSDLEFFVYDVTNSVLIPVSPEVLVGSSSNSFRFKGIFQTSSNSTSYRLIIHTATTTTNNFVVKFDNFSVGPQSSVVGPPVTDWVQYTPTFGNWGTCTNISVFSRRNGDSLEIMASFTDGTTAASTASMTLGYNGTNANVNIDTSKITPASANNVVGHGNIGVTTATSFSVLASHNNTGVLFFGLQGSAGTDATQVATASAISGGSQQITFYAKVPIVGWSSNVLMSNDTDSRVVALNIVSIPTASAINGTANLIWASGGVVRDTHGGYNASTGVYTVPVAGEYQVTASVGINGSGTAVTAILNFQQNGSTKFVRYNQGDANIYVQGTSVLTCNAGDTIQVRPDTGLSAPVILSTAGTSSFDIFRLSGPATVAATESVNARYTVGAGQTPGTNPNNVTIAYDTKTYDTHNAFNTSTHTYTVPVSGKYRVTATVNEQAASNTSAGVIQAVLNHNGSSYSFSASYLGGNSRISGTLVTDTISCLAGDTINAGITMVSSSNPTLDVGYITFERVGN